MSCSADYVCKCKRLWPHTPLLGDFSFLRTSKAGQRYGPCRRQESLRRVRCVGNMLLSVTHFISCECVMLCGFVLYRGAISGISNMRRLSGLASERVTSRLVHLGISKIAQKRDVRYINYS